MREAEILRRFEFRRQAAGNVAADLGDLVGNRVVLATVIFGIGNLPVAFDGAPDELEFLIGRQPIRRHRERRAYGAVFR